ncbi:hypothetical protein PLESTB_000568200 [Pleodorina starrii]|uniref:Uncharacterized protein n=1 Tax=Pleodorina starrii TaxID=330485 RepID=A0A9W6BI10_9CHLO|nr:hypothetical protein PLESTM_000316300 [Pleodorina starrii]GLC51967.1 hypothetical protein PLESTB_000568200 [Pleodorina starrii]GLC68545.1 hypothetical protein PLESTF_000704100 [Pleodorina starrii]
MFGHIAKLASRPAAAAAAAATVANVAQGPAQARAPPAPQGARQAVQLHANSKIVDRDTEGWVLAEMKDELVVFQPFDRKDVDEAASTVMALWGGSASSSSVGPIVTEPGEDAEDACGGSASSRASSDFGDDRLANAVIEAAAAANADALALGRKRDREQLEDLMAITTRMLRRPGMQREVVMCMMEDPEVRELMLRQCDDLDRYLLAAGIHAPHLLPAPENVDISVSDGSGDSAAASAGAAPRAGGPTLVSRVVNAVAGALERAGDALASLGGWLRGRLAAVIPGVGEPRAEDGVGAAEGSDGGARGQRGVSQVLGGVMVLAVAVFCVAIIRKPLVLHVLRSRPAAAAATATAAAATTATAAALRRKQGSRKQDGDEGEARPVA